MGVLLTWLVPLVVLTLAWAFLMRWYMSRTTVTRVDPVEVPEPLRTLVDQYGARGFGPFAAFLLAQPKGGARMIVCVATAPSQTFEVWLDGIVDKGMRIRRRVQATAVSRFPGGDVVTSARANLTMENDVVRMWRGAADDEIVASHMALLESLRSEGVGPLPRDPATIADRYETECSKALVAMRAHPVRVMLRTVRAQVSWLVRRRPPVDRGPAVQKLAARLAGAGVEG